jgi:flagellar basal body-associated protein FliL
MDEIAKPNKKKLWVYIVVAIVVVILIAAGYYFLVIKAAKPIVWDGTYKMTGNLTCTGNIPNLTTVPMDSTFAVSNNNIIEPTIGKIYAIGKNGKASENFQQTANGQTTDVKASYQFYEEGSALKFTADATITLDTTQNGKDFSSVCVGAITGAKQ